MAPKLPPEQDRLARSVAHVIVKDLERHPELPSDGVTIVYAPTSDERAIDRVAELLDALYDDGPVTEGPAAPTAPAGRQRRGAPTARRR